MGSTNDSGLLSMLWMNEQENGIYIIISLWPVNGQSCKDLNGRIIRAGERYHPQRNEPCLECLCLRGKPTACVMTMCADPPCKNFERIEGECCNVRCLDLNSIGGADNRSRPVIVDTRLPASASRIAEQGTYHNNQDTGVHYVHSHS